MGPTSDAEVVVDLVALPPLTRGEVEGLAAALSRRLRARCQVGAELPGDALDARLAGRDQLDADALLARLETLPARKHVVRVGVTALDLAIPIFTFVFGRARAGGAALVSLARLDPRFYGFPVDGALLARRAAAEMVHELGHVAGLAHCTETLCVMRFAASVDQVDVRGDSFCPSCAQLLPAWLRTGA